MVKGQDVSIQVHQGIGHIVGIRGSESGFEDLNLGDHDYNDHVFKVSGIAGVMPEPTGALLFLVGGAIVASHRRAVRR